ncbi:hypothetical protein [Fructilactobacillus florum]|uniref:aldose epimerase family protein n=1 Tax=Fructilactobacillus florum TaxID=640331 RepID=UPI002093D6E4|nr:hypothetical protein [Fructilactobacillus florum]
MLQKGAEVVSVVNSEQLEYLWNGDPKHWKRHAPLLFPIVGRLQDDQYQYDGTIYKMYQHGFARDSNFEIESQSDTQAVFLLRPNATIKKHYPFNFRLYVTYQLLQDTLAVSMLVKNDDQHSMYFSIGAHPAFRVPLEPEHEQFSDYQVEVLPHREYSLIQLNQEGLTTSSESVCGVNTKKIGIMHCLFKDDAKI